MPEERFYSEEEANQILRKATEHSLAPGGSLTRDELLRSAAEAGIPPEAIERAERELAAKRTDEQDRLAYQQNLSRKFNQSVGSWAGTSVLLFGINLLTGFDHLWCLWPIGIWGFVVLGEMLEYYFTKPWNDVEKLKRWQARRAARSQIADSGSPEDFLDDWFSRADETESERKGLVIGVSMRSASTDRKIEAIKALREAYGMDLKKAKDVVDRYLDKEDL
jgi:hypothetical protein